MELVPREEIPHGRGGQEKLYPWKAWKEKLIANPGMALKLMKKDIPEDSTLFKKWGEESENFGSIIRPQAKREGIIIMARGEELYLTLAEEKK